VKRWGKANKEKLRVYQANHLALKAGAEGSYTAGDIKALFQAQGGLCVGCSVDLAKGYQRDHIVPLSKGGSNWPSNIQLLCAFCNRSKWAHSMEDWNRSRGIV
jgi:5-methylcytosine-specific restriction endonuclease McrA